MEEGWIKLYRKILLNDGLFRSSHTFTIWCWLLLRADRKTGIAKVGRYMLAEWLKIKPSTVYQTLKRLENMTMVKLQSNSKVTTVTILNWSKYQSKPTPPNDSYNTKYDSEKITIQQQSNTLQEVKNKELINITNVIVPHYGNEDINQLVEYFKQVMEIPKEDCTQRQSRQYWQLLLKESRTGVEGVKWLVDQAKADEFYSSNITSSKDLYYKRVKILSRIRGKRPKIAIFGGDNNV